VRRAYLGDIGTGSLGLGLGGCADLSLGLGHDRGSAGLLLLASGGLGGSGGGSGGGGSLLGGGGGDGLVDLLGDGLELGLIRCGQRGGRCGTIHKSNGNMSKKKAEENSDVWVRNK